jgi:hypothetical protein
MIDAWTVGKTATRNVLFNNLSIISPSAHTVQDGVHLPLPLQLASRHTHTDGGSKPCSCGTGTHVCGACVCDTFGRSGSESFENQENTLIVYRTSSHLSARLRESGQVVTRQPCDDGKESIVMDRVQSGIPLHGATHGRAQAAIEEADCAIQSEPPRGCTWCGSLFSGN